MSTLKSNIMKGMYRNIHVFLNFFNSSIFTPHYTFFITYLMYFGVLIVWISILSGVPLRGEVLFVTDSLIAGACTIPIYLKTRRLEDVMEILNNPKYKSWKYKLLTVLFVTGWFPFLLSLNWLTDLVEFIF